MSALREEAVGLREALDAQRTQLERHYAGLHAKMRKEYEQVRRPDLCTVLLGTSHTVLLVYPADGLPNSPGKAIAG